MARQHGTIKVQFQRKPVSHSLDAAAAAAPAALVGVRAKRGKEAGAGGGGEAGARRGELGAARVPRAVWAAEAKQTLEGVL